MTKKSALKILIAYENLDAGVRAKKISERVAAQLNSKFNFQNNLYKFDFLSHPQLREEATLEAATADVVIISAHEAGDLPYHVKNWMEEWVPCRRKSQSALVALLGKDDDDQWKSAVTREFLQQMAERAQMDFFCKTDWPLAVNSLLQRSRHGIEDDSQNLETASSDSRWGGND